MTAIDYAKEQVRKDLFADAPCACGKMEVADVSPASEIKIGCQASVFDRDLTRVEGCCRMKCNVCGHVEKKVACAFVNEAGELEMPVKGPMHYVAEGAPS